MGKGYIVVQLFTAREALPIALAKVTITPSIECNSNNFFKKVLETNISGETEKVEVSTKEKEFSLNAVESNIPYELYDISIIADGYHDLLIMGVQVFPDSTSIQRVEMEPVGKLRNGFEIINIPSHQLNVRTYRDKQVGPKGTKVLGNVYIPEYITVHLGSPTSYSENVTVKFIDYIKNVASSEIYPTWPENALKANIYAQISYALNRVYTEWYRNKGYNFQITNSTAYDQCYVKGRNIFENISRIVDDIFNEYISIMGYIEPLFSQYCNGSTVTCGGLSQWGTVDLANKGYLPIEMLKYYYGNNIELIRTSDIKGIVESYPGEVLKRGSLGSQVKVIQKQLNRIARNYTAIPVINPIDGNFNKDTEDSVKVFQKIFNLIQDGIVGRATWYKISDIYVGVKKLADLESEGEKESDIISDNIYPGYLLREGSKGKEVRKLQYYLSFIGDFYYNIPVISVDSIFGAKTKEAVIAFQRKFKLKDDGIVGRLTWNKIYEVYKTIEEGIDESIINQQQYPGRPLKEMSKGEDVEKIQSYLNMIANKYNEISKIDIDGIFGPETRRDVMSFQEKFGLAVDGIVGKTTWDKIVEVYKKLDEIK